MANENTKIEYGSVKIKNYPDKKDGNENKSTDKQSK